MVLPKEHWAFPVREAPGGHLHPFGGDGGGAPGGARGGPESGGQVCPHCRGAHGGGHWGRASGGGSCGQHGSRHWRRHHRGGGDLHGGDRGFQVGAGSRGRVRPGHYCLRQEEVQPSHWGADGGKHQDLHWIGVSLRKRGDGRDQGPEPGGRVSEEHYPHAPGDSGGVGGFHCSDSGRHSQHAGKDAAGAFGRYN